MNYWIFVATYWPLPDGRSLDSREIIRTRAADKFWGLGEKTPNRKWLSKGDKIVWYAGGGDNQVFMGTATLFSASYELTSEQQEGVSHGREEFRSKFGVGLEDIELWPEPKPAKSLVPHLSFIQNKEFWGTYFQGGIRAITEEDFHRIVEGVSVDLGTEIGRQRDLESPSEFAMEQHLEEFIAANWNRIGFGAPLRLYQAEGQTGRQFPAGRWSIDFLAVDANNGDFIVIELKRGRSSDAVAGQVLAYMSWVRENICTEGQKVRGMVIAKEVDDRLRYALMGQPVSIKTYEVNFQLRDS